MDKIVKRSAGLDVHKMVIVATIVIDRDESDNLYVETRSFKTYQCGRKELAQWLADSNIELIIMESTGVYWKSLYATLEEFNLNAWVVNARHIKQVPGRKTDVSDSQWLAQLGRYGLVKPSFIPTKPYRELRLLTRRRQKVVGMLATEKLRLHKQLDDAGIRLGGVATDINGKSAKDMIAGLIQGQPPEELVKLARGRLKSKSKDLLLSLDESLSTIQKNLLEQIQTHMVFLEQQIAELDVMIFEQISQNCLQEWQLLQTIPGISQISAGILLAELGSDMEVFGNIKQLSSWAGVCPGNNESAGKRRSGKTTKGNVWLRQILCEIAQAASKTNCQFKGYYQGLIIRRGKKRSIIALAHKILRISYSVMQNKTAYVDPGIDYKELVVKRNSARWLRTLKEYGFIEEAKAVSK